MPRRLHPVVLFVALVLVLSWPLVVLRVPVLSGDTAGYLYLGETVLRAAGNRASGSGRVVAVAPVPIVNKGHLAVARLVAVHPELLPPDATTAVKSQRLKWPLGGGRSLYYGTFAATISWLGGWRAIAIAQIAAVALMLTLAILRFGLRSARQQAVAVLVLGFGASLGFTSAVLLPDVFSGFAAVGLILIALFGGEMSRRELLFWLVALLSILLVHKAFLMLGLVMVAVIALHALVHRRTFGRARLAALLPGAAVAGLALVVTLATNPLLARIGGPQIVEPPFLLARSIGDGPAAATLREICPVRAWLNCVVVPALPLSEEDYLWGPSPRTADRPDIAWHRMAPDIRVLMVEEQLPLLLATLQRHPGWQARASLGNAARQFASVGLTQFDTLPHVLDDAARRGYAAEVARLRLGGIAQHDFPLAWLSGLWAAIYGFSVFGAVLLLVLGRRARVPRVDPRVTDAAALMIAALGVNAVINGTLSGVFDRYQGRVAWLAAFALLLLVAHMLHGRRSENRA